MVEEVAGVEANADDADDVEAEAMKILAVLDRAPSGGVGRVKRQRRAVSGGATKNAYMAYGHVLKVGYREESNLVRGIEKRINICDVPIRRSR